MSYRDVSAGATGATEVAPKFSDTLTLSQPGGGGRFCPPSQRANLNFPRGYVPEHHKWDFATIVGSQLFVCCRVSRSSVQWGCWGGCWKEAKVPLSICQNWKGGGRHVCFCFDVNLILPIFNASHRSNLVPKLYIPSTLNIDLILHTMDCVCSKMLNQIESGTKVIYPKYSKH